MELVDWVLELGSQQVIVYKRNSRASGVWDALTEALSESMKYLCWICVRGFTVVNLGIIFW